MEGHLNELAACVVAAGLVVRLAVAYRSYLNPDEALHYLVVNQPSAYLAYEASRTEAHPPLLYVLLYFWRLLGRSELMLRMPSVLAGTAFCWASFMWMKDFFSKTAAMVALMLITFSPAMINLSAELRQYAALLCCIAGSLYFFERALREGSARQMWYFSVFLYLAVLSHYSAILFVLAISLYALVRITDHQVSRKVVPAWIAGQAGALAIYVFLYLTHISKVTANIASWEIPFGQFYFNWRDGDLYFFLRENTSNIFLYLFKERYVSGVVLLFFVFGVVLLFARGLFPGRGNRRSCHLAILVSLPFLANWAAAIAGIYPYIGSRHTIFLAPFGIAAASFLIASLVRQKLWAGVLIAALLVGICNASEDPSRARITKENQRRELMTSAIAYVHKVVRPGDLILLDQQSSFVMAYYLCGANRTPQLIGRQGELLDFSCEGYSSVALRLWKLKPENFVAAFEQAAHSHHLQPGARVWVVQAGWGANLDKELPLQSHKFRCLNAATFGQNITVIPFVTGSDLSPTVTCQTSRSETTRSEAH